MADYNSSLPVRTQNNGDVVIELADGTTPTQKAAVNASGSVQVAGQGVSGTPAGGVVSIQGVSGGQAVPVTGSITISDPAEGPVGSPPPSDAIYVGGLVSTSSPSYTTGNMESFSLTLAGAIRVDASGTTQPVSGTVTANQGTAAALAGAWPVEITDGTNVLGTSAHPLVNNMTQVGGSSITLGQKVMASSLPVVIASDQSAVASNITQIGGSAPSASNFLPIQITTGAAYVSSSNPLPVTIDPAAAGTPKNYYTDSAAVGIGSTVTQSTTAAGSTGLYVQQVYCSGSGKFKAVVQVETGVSTGIFNVIFATFNSTATPYAPIPLPAPTLVATGVRIQVLMTNNDLSAQDLYSTISGYQI